MSEKRITVWVQRFKDRRALMLQWIDPETGRRKSKSAKTDDEEKAEQKRADLEYELNHGLHKELARLTWDRFRELFAGEFASGKRPRTRENYEDTLNVFEEVCHPTSVRTVSERTVSAFVAGLRKRKVHGREGHKQSTIKVRLQFLRTVLGWAVEQGFLAKCPKFPTVKPPKKKPQPVAAEMFERLVEKAPDDNMRAYLLTGWLAGLRLAEAAELRWEPTTQAPYLALDRNRIILPAEFVKSDEDQWLPLDPLLKAALLALPRREDDPKVFQFVEHRPGREARPICIAAISHRVCRLAKEAGLRLTMHTLRKGFGCRYAGKVPAQVLQRLMRHANIKTTMDYYANIDAAVEEAVLGPKESQRNTGRNTQPVASEPAQEGVAANGCDSESCAISQP